jgi:hypothetical protein
MTHEFIFTCTKIESTNTVKCNLVFKTEYSHVFSFCDKFSKTFSFTNGHYEYYVDSL